MRFFLLCVETWRRSPSPFIFAQLMAELAPELDDAEPYLRLILNTLHLLSSGKRPQLQLKAIFEMRLLSIAGYMPNLVACETCGAFESDPMFFDAVHGRLYCANCRPKGMHDTLPIGIVTAMRHIVFSDFDKVFHFTLPDDSIRRWPIFPSAISCTDAARISDVGFLSSGILLIKPNDSASPSLCEGN